MDDEDRNAALDTLKPARLKQLYLCEVANLPAGPAYPFKNGDVVVMLGELANMPGHVVVALPDGRVVFGYHLEWFRRLRPEET